MENKHELNTYEISSISGGNHAGLSTHLNPALSAFPAALHYSQQMSKKGSIHYVCIPGAYQGKCPNNEPGGIWSK